MNVFLRIHISPYYFRIFQNHGVRTSPCYRAFFPVLVSTWSLLQSVFLFLAYCSLSKEMPILICTPPGVIVSLTVSISFEDFFSPEVLL